VTFGLGLVAILGAITYGLQPYGGHNMGWTSPKVLAAIVGGVVLLAVFVMIEIRSSDPMIDLRLFRNRAFAAGNAVNLLASMARGGLQFMLIIWLQGIWLPLHGYKYADTPLWAGIYMLPLTVGFLIAGPVSGALSDRRGARAFATGGLLITAASYGGLLMLPANFNYVLFAGLLVTNGIGMGLVSAPNAAAIMNAVPASARGAASGVRATGMNAGMVLSMGGFFTLMAVGLASRLPNSLSSGLIQLGVTPAAAHQVANTPPVGTLFAAFLGNNPVTQLLKNVDPTQLQPGHGVDLNTLNGRAFFPHLIAEPFMHGLLIAFGASIIMLLIAAAASLARGKQFVHADAMAVPEGERIVEALAREGAALESPNIPGNDVAYENAVRAAETDDPAGSRRRKLPTG
jgi:MFS family permease